MAKARTLANLVSSGGTLATPSIISVPGTAVTGGSIRLAEDTDNGTHYIGLKAPDSITTSLDFNLPANDGVAGQVLITDGSRNLSFASISLPQAKQVIDTAILVQTGYNAMSMDAIRVTTGGSITIKGGSKYAIKSF